MTINDTSFTTKYNSDKIVFSIKGSASISSMSEWYNYNGYIIKKLELPHGMPKPLFTEFRFSIDNGKTWRTGGGAEDSIAFCNDTNIVLLLQPSLTGTFMYEVYGIWIDDYDTNKPFIETLNISNNKLFDSRYSYRKIHKYGSTVPVYNEQTFSYTSEIPHDGNKHSFRLYFVGSEGVWQQHSGGSKDLWEIDFDHVGVWAWTDNSNLYIDSSSNYKVYYRIFVND